MKTRNKTVLLLLTSVICLLPLILSIVLYNGLPEQMAIHWNSDGSPDTFVPKAIAAFGLPFLFFAINLYSKLRLYNDPKRSENNHAQAVQMISTWIPPLSSLILAPMTLFIAMGATVPINMIVSTFTGILLVICGNYLPKCRQNYTIGIKLPWTLYDADNWNKTHRLAGYLWMLAGIILMVGTFLLTNSTFSGFPMLVILVVLLVMIPALYSYGLYSKTRKEQSHC